MPWIYCRGGEARYENYSDSVQHLMDVDTEHTVRQTHVYLPIQSSDHLHQVVKTAAMYISLGIIQVNVENPEQDGPRSPAPLQERAVTGTKSEDFSEKECSR